LCETIVERFVTDTEDKSQKKYGKTSKPSPIITGVAAVF
jgi:hypothetical protein